MDLDRGIMPLELLDFDLQEASIKQSFFFCFFNLVFDQRNLYVTLFTKKKGFDEFGVRCWDLELDWRVLVSFLCWVGKDCGALGYLGYWIWSSC